MPVYDVILPTCVPVLCFTLVDIIFGELIIFFPEFPLFADSCSGFLVLNLYMDATSSYFVALELTNFPLSVGSTFAFAFSDIFIN